MSHVVTLSGGSPWGFRLVGGCDFHATLSISKVTPGGKAERAGLKAGDVILAINNNETAKLSHLEAQNKVKSSTGTLLLKVESSASDGNAPTPPNPTPIPQNSTPVPSYPSKPATFTSTSAHSWKPKAAQPPPPSSTKTPPPPPSTKAPPPSLSTNAPLPPPPSNDDFLPPPPADLLQQEMKKLPMPQDDFPAPPPPKTVQVTTQQASSTDGIVCEGCKQPILSGSYLSAKGKNWHPDEFVCSAPNCGKSLQGCGFIEEKGQRYCSDCYEKNYAHLCGKCHKKIIGEVMHALNQTWHVTCFVCEECGRAFRDGVFQLENNKPYCVEDFNRLFGTNCKRCGQAITAGDHYVEALKAHWHGKCFNCEICHVDLGGGSFFAISGKPVCDNHKNARLP